MRFSLRLVGTNGRFQFSGLSCSGVRVCMPHSSLLIISPEGKENCNSRGAVGMAEEQLLRAAKLKLRRSIKSSLYKAQVVRCVHWQLPGGGGVTTEVFSCLLRPSVLCRYFWLLTAALCIESWWRTFQCNIRTEDSPNRTSA